MAFRRGQRGRPRRGFRRKRRVVWFPNLGSIWQAGELEFHDTALSGGTTAVPAQRGSGPFPDVYPVIPDFSTFTDGTDTHTLRDDVEGQTWALERIVGRCHVEVDASQGPDDQTDHNAFWASVQVAAGFFIARASDTDQSLPEGTNEDIDPLNAGNTQNPWIWRKSWILANEQSFDVGAPATSNAVVTPDGGYIDSKVRRYIPREHRLWFAISALGWHGTQIQVVGGEVQPRVIYNLDCRILGGMRRGRNTSSF